MNWVSCWSEILESLRTRSARRNPVLKGSDLLFLFLDLFLVFSLSCSFSFPLALFLSVVPSFVFSLPLLRTYINPDGRRGRGGTKISLSLSLYLSQNLQRPARVLMHCESVMHPQRDRCQVLECREASFQTAKKISPISSHKAHGSFKPDATWYQCQKQRC